MKRGYKGQLFLFAIFLLIFTNTTLSLSTTITECLTINDSGVYTINDSFATGDLGVGNVCIWINASDVVLNGTWQTLSSSNSSYYGVYAVNASNVTVENLNLTGFYQGIYFFNASNSSIISNNLYSNIDAGIVLSSNSNNDRIISNTVTSNGTGDGIYVYNSSIINVISNIISQDFYGIYFYKDSSSNITLNNITNSTFGIYLLSSTGNNITLNNVSTNYFGIDMADSSRNLFDRNNISNSRISFLQDSRTNNGFNNTVYTSNLVDYIYKIYYNFSISNYIYNLSTTPNAAAVFCGLCNNITVKDLNLTSPMKAGILFFNVTNSSVQNVSSYNSYFGTFLDLSSGNNLTSNRASNYTYGIYLYHSSGNNLKLNTLSGGYYGIETAYGSSNVFDRNNMSSNNYFNFGATGDSNDDFNHTVYTSNLLDSSYKIYYNYSIGNYTYDLSTAPDAAAVFCSLCNNITVKDLNFNHSMQAGVSFFNVNNSVVQNVTIHDNYYGIYLDSSENNSFVNDTVTEDDPVSSGVLIYNSANGTSFIDCTLTHYYIDTTGSLISFKNSNNGEIRFLIPINGTGTNLSRDVNIGSNSAYVNSTVAGMNSSANITLYGITYTDPKPQYSFNGATFADCTATTDPACTELSFNATALTFVFNVTHFTYFRAAEAYVAPVTASSPGGGGSVTPSYWNMTYAFTDSQFERGYSKELAVKDRIQVSVNHTVHSIGVVSLTSSTATINVSSIPQQATFLTGESKKFDVTNDLYYDILATLNSIANNRANITLLAIHEVVTQTPDSQTGNNLAGTGTDTNSNAKRNLTWLWILIAAVVVIAAAGSAVYFFVFKRKKAGRNKGRILRKSVR